MVKPKLWQNYSMLGDLSFTGRGESIYGGYGFGCVNIYGRTWDPVCHFPEILFVCGPFVQCNLRSRRLLTLIFSDRSR